MGNKLFYSKEKWLSSEEAKRTLHPTFLYAGTSGGRRSLGDKNTVCSWTYSLRGIAWFMWKNEVTNTSTRAKRNPVRSVTSKPQLFLWSAEVLFPWTPAVQSRQPSHNPTYILTDKCAGPFFSSCHLRLVMSSPSKNKSNTLWILYPGLLWLCRFGVYITIQSGSYRVLSSFPFMYMVTCGFFGTHCRQRGLFILSKSGLFSIKGI